MQKEINTHLTSRNVAYIYGENGLLTHFVNPNDAVGIQQPLTPFTMGFDFSCFLLDLLIFFFNKK